MSVSNIGITEPIDSATLSLLAELTESGGVQTKGLWNFRDLFNGLSLDTGNWTPSQTGGGEVSLDPTAKRVQFYSGSIGRAATMAYQTTLDPTEEWAIILNTDTSPIRVITGGDNFSLFDNATIPGHMSAAAYSAGRVFTYHGNALLYVPSGGGFFSWNGSTWVSGSGATFSSGQAAKLVLINKDDGGTIKWQFLGYGWDGTLSWTTPLKPWSDVKTISDLLWVMAGSPRNNALLLSSDLFEFFHFAVGSVDKFPTSAQSFTTKPYTTDEPVNSEEVTFKLRRTPLASTEIKGYIKEDAGAFGAAHNINVTPIAGEPGWFALAAGATYSNHTTLTIKGEMNSPDTDTQLEIIEIKIKGITVTGDIATVFQLPLETVELPALEVIER